MIETTLNLLSDINYASVSLVALLTAIHIK